MLREFTVIIIVTVCVTLSASAKDELHNTVSEQQTAHPDGCFIIFGGFQPCKLKKVVLPKFYQHVNLAKTGNDRLDKDYTS